MLVLQHPSERECAHLDAEALGDGLELVDLLDGLVELLLARALPPAGDELDLLLREARALGHAVLVLSGQQALAQRREDRQACPDLAVEMRVLDLDLLAAQHVVLGLLHDGADEAELVGVPPGLRDLVRVPHRRAPVQRLARVDEVVESADCLLHGCLSVWPVRVDHVDIVEAQTFQGGVHAFDDVLSREPPVVNRAIAECASEVKLRSYVSLAFPQLPRPGPQGYVPEDKQKRSIIKSICD